MDQYKFLQVIDVQIKYALYFSILILFISSCGLLIYYPEPVYESAIRHYLDSWSTLPDTIVVSVEGENPSETLLNRLGDIETNFVTQDTKKISVPGSENHYQVSLSVKRLRNFGFKTIKVRISSSRSPYDAHGIEYHLEKKKDYWVVVKEGSEWMT